MKKNIAALILVVFLAVFSTSINLGLGSSGDFKLLSAYWGSTSPIEVTGGDYTSIVVLLRYEGKWSFNNLMAKLNLPNTIKASNPDNKAVIYYKSTINPGTIIQLEYQVYITPQASKGVYLLTLELEYFVPNYGLTIDVIHIPMEITGRPNIQMRIANETVFEGKQKITLNIENIGDAEAYNLQITKVYSSSITINTINNTYIECIKPNETFTSMLDVYIPSTMKGKTIQVNVDVIFHGPRNSIYTKTYTIQTLVNPQEIPPQINVQLSTGELYIGKINSINARIINTIDADLRDVKITMSTDAILKVFGTSTTYVERIKPGQIMEIPMEIYVPLTTSATGSLTIVVSYYDTEKQISRSETNQFTILLKGFIEITLTDVTIIPSSPRPGSPFSITITITNTGTSTAYATHAIPILENLPIQPFGSRSVYIGNVDVNMPTTFTLNLQLLNTTQSQVKLPVMLRYMDNLRYISNVIFNITINISPAITTTTTTQSRGTITTIITNPITIISTIIIVAVIIGMIIMRRRKK
ncbi:MAG: hypothetical protein QXO74_01935 [Candidatus Methanomethylicia archaeon]